jgi:homoserine kinase
MDEVTVRVPATTANLGPGFDCLGVALRLYNQVTVRRSRSGTKLPPIVSEAAESFFNKVAARPFRFRCSIAGEIPQARGLGSSVTVRLGVLAALNRIAGTGLSSYELFKLCAALEGHPDNAAPAAFGGFTVACGLQRPQRFEVRDLYFVLIVPNFEVATVEARNVLPKKVSHEDATISSANACRVTAALASGKPQLLRGCFDDRLHQPYRLKLVPFMNDVIAAGVRAGAIGGFLSGSGSTIACVTMKKPAQVAAAMHKAVPATAAPQVLVLLADNAGARVVRQPF